MIKAECSLEFCVLHLMYSGRGYRSWKSTEVSVFLWGQRRALFFCLFFIWLALVLKDFKDWDTSIQAPHVRSRPAFEGFLGFTMA